MNERIVLAYRRSTAFSMSDPQLFDGQVQIQYSDRVEITSFKNLTFRDLLGVCSSKLQLEPTYPLYFTRMEGKGEPLPLDAETTHLIRETPEQASFYLHSLDVHVDVPRPRLHTIIRSGYETLSASFGEVIYCRRHGSLIESPLDGHWCGIDGFDRSLADDSISKWWGIRTADLLEQFPTQVRFFFPREWNQGRPWISREDLTERYQSYLKEKAECSRTATHEG